ncbi:UNVERIFIED_CONTAM: hypothetical protein K2H54_062249 [Gekko kuhli]
MDPTPRPRSQVVLGVPMFFTPSGLSQQGARLLQPRVVPNQFTMYNPGNGMLAGSLTQWGHFNPGSTTETYLLTEGPCRESPWDLPGDSGYQASGFSTNPGGSEDSLARWYKELSEGRTRVVAKIEVPVEGPIRGGDDEDDLWMRRMAAIETGQLNLQRHLEEVVRAILEMVVRALAAERAAEQQSGAPPPGEEPPGQLFIVHTEILTKLFYTHTQL